VIGFGDRDEIHRSQRCIPYRPVHWRLAGHHGREREVDGYDTAEVGKKRLSRETKTSSEQRIFARFWDNALGSFGTFEQNWTAALRRGQKRNPYCGGRLYAPFLYLFSETK